MTSPSGMATWPSSASAPYLPSRPRSGTTPAASQGCRWTTCRHEDDMAQERQRTGAVIRQAHRDASPGEAFPALEVACRCTPPRPSRDRRRGARFREADGCMPRLGSPGPSRRVMASRPPGRSRQTSLRKARGRSAGRTCIQTALSRIASADSPVRMTPAMSGRRSSSQRICRRNAAGLPRRTGTERARARTS